MTRISRFAVLTVLAVAAAFLTSPVAAGAAMRAAGCTPHGTAAGKHVNATTVGRELAALDQAGKPQTQVNAIMRKDWCLKLVTSRRVRAAGPTSSRLAIGGGTVMSPAQVSGVEDPDDVKWLIEDVFRQYGGATRDDFAEEKYTWNNHDYTVDDSWLTGCGYNESEGGQDGMALGLSEGTWNTVSQSLEVYGDPGLDSYDGDYHIRTINSGGHDYHGIWFKWQDNTRNVNDPSTGYCTSHVDLDDYRGIMVWEFYETYGNCFNYARVMGDYVHTWNDTGVQGFTIGLGSSGDVNFGMSVGTTGSSDFENTSNGAYSDNQLC